MRRISALTIVLLALCSLAPSALAEKRVALVVGNDRYANLPALQKAVNDAEAVGNTLARLGFEVIRGRDLGRQGMIDKLAEFAARLEAGDTALFFYAGHGVAIGGVNYLVPTDVPAATAGGEVRVRGASIAEPDIVAEIQARGARVAVLVLDACRDNPFPRAGTRTLGNSRGLADAKPASGVFTLYSAGIGQSALDVLEPNDRNLNSVFTRVFVEQLARPGLHIGDLAIEVREKVAEIARTARDARGEPAPHVQTPAYYDQTIGGKVFLAGRAVAVERSTPVVSQPVPADPDAAVRRDYEFAERAGTTAAWDAFLARHPNGFYADLARVQRGKLAVVVPPVRPATPSDTTPKPAVGVFPTTPGVTPLSAERERALKPKDSFKECDTCPEMVVVPAGSFTMGSPPNETDRSSDEGPQHLVRFSRQFAVGKFAVTFGEWDACVADGGCNGYRPSDSGWGRGQRPVINVNWDDAKAYVAWLSRKTGKSYRLLSEAEREYVARAGTTTPFWWGSTISTDQANYDGNYAYSSGSRGEFRKKTVPVDSFQPNPWGLYQVHGNVWEWIEDCYKDNYAGAPTDGSASTAGDCRYRVLRGGSWFNRPRDLRSADRVGLSTVNRHIILGFRVARTLIAP